MNAKFLLCVMVLWFAKESFGFKCYTCDNLSCGSPAGYVSEECPASQCYYKKNNDNKVFQAGCFTNQCRLRGRDPSCVVCGSELCNAPNAPQLKEPKIGDGAKPSASSKPELITAIALGVCALYIA